MKDGFAQSMNGLHSWSGLLFGWVMFATFLTGTLTVFDNEITAWMQPELQELSSANSGLHDGVVEYVAQPAQQADRRQGEVPIDGMPIMTIKWQGNRTFSGQAIDPVTGQLIMFRDTQGGDLFYHFHYELLLGSPGVWIVGASGLAMLLASFTGVVVHRPISKDLFAFRPQSFPYRAWLYAHNMTGLLVFPFQLMIAFTGLVVLWTIYLSIGLPVLSHDNPAATLFVTLTDGASSKLPSLQPAYGQPSQSVLFDLHFAQFGSALVRWLYFLMGLASSVVIATGLVSWTTKRRRYDSERRHAWATRLMESLNVAAVAGLIVAIAAFLWANRLLPVALPGRASWEVRSFFFTWCCCLVHSLLRGGSMVAWKSQLSVAALMLGSLPLLNALATKSHLLATIPKGQWAVAGVDLTALVSGVLLGWMVRRLGRGGLAAVENLQRVY